MAMCAVCYRVCAVLAACTHGTVPVACHCVLQGLRCSRCLYTRHCAGCVSLCATGSALFSLPVHTALCWLCVTVCCRGLRCSRCLYTQHCAGCVLPRDGTDISLQPGDHLAVQFFDLSESQMELSLRFIDHTSLKLSRSTEPLSLYDCFHAFTERFVSFCRFVCHNPYIKITYLS